MTCAKTPFCVELGGIRVSFGLDDPRARALARLRYRGFLSRKQPHVRLALSGRRAERRIKDPVVMDGPMIACRSARFSWELDADQRSSRTRSCRATSCGKPEDLDSLLRTLFARLALERGGIILHAAAFRGPGAAGTAHLFAGPSGAGKTTLMRRLESAHAVRCLSDELVLAMRTASGWRLHSTPFWGEFGMPENNGSAPLGRILFLGKGPLGLSPVGAADAQAGLLRCLVTFEKSPESLTKAWDAVLDMVRSHETAKITWDGKAAEKLAALLWNGKASDGLGAMRGNGKKKETSRSMLAKAELSLA